MLFAYNTVLLLVESPRIEFLRTLSENIAIIDGKCQPIAEITALFRKSGGWMVSKFDGKLGNSSLCACVVQIWTNTVQRTTIATSDGLQVATHCNCHLFWFRIFVPFILWDSYNLLTLIVFMSFIMWLTGNLCSIRQNK